MAMAFKAEEFVDQYNSLCSMERQSMWTIENSTFSYKELLLMANLSATLLGLRGGISND